MGYTSFLPKSTYASFYFQTHQQIWSLVYLDSAVTRRVARGAMGAISPPIPKVAPKIFRSIKLLMSKPKKYFSANHRKCLRNLLHNLVEPAQSTVVQQLSMINQTLCTRGVGNNRFFQVKPRIFVGWAKMVKFHFFHSKLRKQPFC